MIYYLIRGYEEAMREGHQHAHPATTHYRA
jgi:hypothetical protein